MLRDRVCHCAGLAALVLGLNLSAEKSPASFGFGSPEVIKLDWSTRSLTPADLDGDGLRDLVVVNNDAGKIELLYQLAQGEQAGRKKKNLNRNRWEPVLEDARFEKRSLTVGFPVFDIVVHDFNADGRVDLAYTSGEVPLTVRYQSVDGEWVNSREYDGFEAVGWTNSIKASDVDRDGKVELFVLSANAIRVFNFEPDGSLGEPRLLHVSGGNPFNMMLFDVTGDDRSDLLYLSTDGKQVLAMREQVENGQFGPESRYEMERPARMVVPVGAVNGDQTRLAAVNSRSGSLEFMRLRSREEAAGGGNSALQDRSPEIYPIFAEAREAASYALGDMDGDGDPDLVVANPAKAELTLYERTKGRFQTSPAFPSFSAVSSLAAGRFFEEERESLIVMSEEEKTLGLSGLDRAGRLSFPQQLKIGSGDPAVTSAADVDDDGYDELLLVNEDWGDYSLIVAAPSDRKNRSSSWEVRFEQKLDGIRRRPFAIEVMHVFGADRPGLVLFVPREAPVLLRPAAGESGIALEQMAAESSIRESLFKDIGPAETSVFDVDGDGVNELVVGRTGFARAFKVVGDGLEMVDQFNARRGSDEVAAIIPLEDEAGVENIALYVSGERELQFLKRDPSGVFRYNRSVSVGALDLQDWFRLPATGKRKGEAFLFAGKDRFWHFNQESRALSWEIDNIYETDLEDIHYSHLAAADFDRDGRPELIAVDGNEHVLDVLGRDDGEFRSRMFWQVFEQNMHYQGRTGAKLEPRQVVIDELTGDGLLDLAVLVHDRVLIYPQQ